MSHTSRDVADRPFGLRNARWRTWLRVRTPDVLYYRLGLVVPKARDCRHHEWHHSANGVDACYHCEVTRSTPAAMENDPLTAAEQRICIRCHVAVVANWDHYETFERMHWSCFHYEFEHPSSSDDPRANDPDVACGDPGCPARAFDRTSPNL